MWMKRVKRAESALCPGQGAVLEQSVWCPEGGRGACIVGYHLCHYGEADQS